MIQTPHAQFSKKDRVDQALEILGKLIETINQNFPANRREVAPILDSLVRAQTELEKLANAS